MPAKHASNLQRTYAQVADGYEKHNAENVDITNLQKFIKNIQKPGKVLDLGCGNGRDSRWLGDQGVQVTMFDLSPEMLQIAREKVPEATAVQGDMTEMDFADGSFDGVWASASILHLTKVEAKKVVKKVFNILKKNGVFYCLLKKGQGEVELNDDKYGTPMTRFFAFYSQSEAQQLFEEAGFSEITVESSQSNSGQEWIDIFSIKK